jgi:alkylation response protein AidB-like acyl-CoA dehydrogenase
MDLDFTPEQDMLREVVRGLTGAPAVVESVRGLEDDPVGYSPELWDQFAKADLIGLMIDEAHGGSGMGLLEAVVVYEELGRSLAPTPLFVSAALAAGVISRAGTTEQQAAWLPRIASGESILSIAWLEPENGFSAKGVQVRATSDGDDLVLTGTKRHVAFASSAERLVTLVRTGDGDNDIALVLVDPNASGVTLTQKKTIASDTQYDVTFDGVRVPAADRLGGADANAWDAWDATMHDGAILAAAQAVGGVQYALEITTQYAKDREQFDKPLGAFQALAHDLANAKTAVDGATLLTYEAAWARSEGRDVTKLAPMAKLFACQTYRDVTATAQQIFGGVGFTLEYDIQLYFRRAKQLQISWWNDRYLEELVAAQVLDDRVTA